MKYNELIRSLKKAGCYDTGKQQAGHPLWYSPKTGKFFKVSNHGKGGCQRHFECYQESSWYLIQLAFDS